MKARGFVVVLLVVALVALFALLVSADMLIHVRPQTLSDYECNEAEWHFVINQISDESLAPPSIEVYWKDGTSSTVTREPHFTGGVAHYISTKHLSLGFVVDATATIYDGWGGNFNLSHGPCHPTAVRLVSFTAEVADSQVSVQWETATEVDNLGFNLYRSEAVDGPRLLLNSELIPAENPGNPSGNQYEFVDPDPLKGTGFYWLGAIDVYGSEELYGPAAVTSSLLPNVFRIFLPFISVGD